MSKREHTENASCVLCTRVVELTFHHLIPRKMHRRTHFKKHFNREQLNEGIHICRKCHNGIHAAYDEMTLAKELNTLELLQQDEVLRKHFEWVAKQK